MVVNGSREDNDDVHDMLGTWLSFSLTVVFADFGTEIALLNTLG